MLEINEYGRDSIDSYMNEQLRYIAQKSDIIKIEYVKKNGTTQKEDVFYDDKTMNE